jgi:glycosyltransferase involved in cell wall biosynthesis
MITFLLTNQSADDISYWSGIPYFSRNALKKKYEVVSITPAKRKFNRFIIKSFNWLRNKLNVRYNINDSLIISIMYLPYIYYIFLWKYRKTRCVIIAEAVTSELLFIPRNIKIILFSDATFSLVKNKYAKFTNLSEFSYWESMQIEKLAYRRADHVVFTSEWARNSAIRTIGVDNNNTSICHFGSNIPDRYNKIIIDKRITNPTVTFFLPSTDWERKGGKIAIDFVVEFSKFTGVKSELILCGETPKNLKSDSITITSLGWISKIEADHLDIIISAYERSNFVILPTLFDCTPVVISEAFCYGVPVLTNSIGGISEIIKPDRNGHFLDLESYSNSIDWVNSHLEATAYSSLSKNARLDYEKKMNWENWANHIDNVLIKLL